ncbi:hypothetical protein MOQ11_07155 [Stenotrophomonas maltophilia]|uniref:hypothetical protein n=1 Tax=Stenotrophomonas maltophilia TaxID=40324 RepID=UPI001F5397B5|nr:hypothetical protein [Stenotrophomonas maltophilia]MCI1131661.1 hypothetical protein [Stenotrophomonas maltophilia]
MAVMGAERACLLAGVLLVTAGCSGDNAGAAVGSADVAAAPVSATAVASKAPLGNMPDAGPAASAQAADQTLGAAPPALTAHGRKPTTRGSLDGENMLMSEGALSDQEAGKVIGSSKAYARALLQFERDAAGNPEAQDLTTLYRAAVARTLGPDMALASFACGYSLCMGEIHNGNADGFSHWTRTFGDDSAAPQYAFMSGEFLQGGGQSIGRFVFSTDLAANGITTR